MMPPIDPSMGPLKKWDYNHYVEEIKAGDGKVLGYRTKNNIHYYSERYKKHVVVSKGEVFDGATNALDIPSLSWVIHDVLCRDGTFADGSECSNWQASQILQDILKKEGRWFRARTWFWATWLLGGGKARDNGLF